MDTCKIGMKLHFLLFLYGLIFCSICQWTRGDDDLSSEFAKQIMRRSKAADIKAALNEQIDPCENFYKFSCGNWARSNPAQLFKSLMRDKFQDMSKAFDRRLEKMLNGARRNATAVLEAENLQQKAADFYKSCLAVQTDTVAYQLSLENVYKEFSEAFPILPDMDWREQNFDWWETIGQINYKYGQQIILAVDVMGDVLNNSQTVIYLGPPDFSVTANVKILNLLQEVSTVRNLHEFFGVDMDTAKKTAKEMIGLQRTLVQGGTDSRLGKSIAEMLTPIEYAALKPNMQRFLGLALGNETEIPEQLYIYDKPYVDNVLKTVADTPKRVLVNYIMWELLQKYLVEVDSAELPSWCIEQTKQHFGTFIDHLVYQTYKTERCETEVYALWEEIRQAFKDKLQGDKLDWIANSTREYALEKLNAMNLSINSYDDVDFEELFGAIKIDAQHYVYNLQQIFKHASQNERSSEAESLTKKASETAELSFTATYNVMTNSITIPVALLQPHYFWDPFYPQALKYASLGYLIAHEMIHGFDDSGRTYDKDGNLLNWWDRKSVYEFESRRKCFQAQYHNYRYGGKQLPDSVSQAENIADNAGVKLAYDAYLRWLRSKKADNAKIEQEDEVLPGLPFNNRQLFFVSFAQVWCDDVQTLFKSSVAAVDDHAPSMFRVIGSLSNFQEFSWVFECKPEATMDPEFKCSIY